MMVQSASALDTHILQGLLAALWPFLGQGANVRLRVQRYETGHFERRSLSLLASYARR